MVGILLPVHLGRILLFSFIIYLFGMATPLLLLYLVANDKQDSCFLNAMLWAIIGTLGLLFIILITV